MVPTRIGISGIDRKRVFRREDELIAGLGHELANELLAASVRVVVGGVDEVPAGGDKGIEDPTTLVAIGTPSPVRSERHRSQAELRNAEAATAEDPIIHHAT